ncbi:MAG TPA: hypothetical protein VGK71_08175 [Nitrospirota bacterium]|jgi:hypothetical protein
MDIVLVVVGVWAVFTAGALVSAKMIGKRSWADTIRWMLEFFN